MTTLKEFLEDKAHLTHQQALDAAKTHQVNVPVFITSNTMTVYVVSMGLYDVFTDVANDVNSPVRGICLALMDRLKGQSEFNLSGSLPLGQANIQMLDTLIAVLTAHSDKLNQLKSTLMAVSNKISYPFESTVLYDIMIERGACPTKSINIVNGWYVVTTAVECPNHNPQIYALNERTNKWQRVQTLYNLNKPSVYEVQIPSVWMNHQLRIDDAYGVL